MGKCKIELIVVTVILMTASTTSEIFEIIRRRPDGNDGWKRGTDLFTIPHSLFSQGASISLNCSSFNAKDILSESTYHYYCSCFNEDATLIFNNDEWKCRKNSKVRDLLEFNNQNYVFFHNEDKNSELRMLINNDKRRLTLPKQWKKCAVDQSSSWYIKCDGTKDFFGHNAFTIVKGGKKGSKKYYLEVISDMSNSGFLRGRIVDLRIKCTKPDISRRLLFKFEGTLNCSMSMPILLPSITTKSLKATTIKITATITAITTSTTTAAKAMHVATSHTSALVSLPITSVTNPISFVFPSTTSDRLSTISGGPLTTSETLPMVTSSTLPNSPSTNSKASLTTSVSSSSVFVATRTPSVPRPTVPKIPAVTFLPTSTTQARHTTTTKQVPTQPSSGHKQRSGASSSWTLALIASVICIILIIIAIVAFLCYRRRFLRKKPHSRGSSQENKVSVMMTAQTNSAYELDGQNLYKALTFKEPPIYASHYKVPHRPTAVETDDKKNKEIDEASNGPEDHFYTPLNIPKEQNIYGLGNSQELDNEEMYQNYNSMCIEQPVYNFLEELSTAEGASGNLINETEPVYNVLEEPYGDLFGGSDRNDTISSEGPIYNTLERPYPDGAEGPYDLEGINEPIYNVLDEEPYPSVSAEDDVYYGARVFQNPQG